MILIPAKAKRVTTSARAETQRGVAMIGIVIIIGTALLGALFAFFSGNRIKNDLDAKDLDILAHAKAALIGYAATSPTRPGELPCPDRNHDGLDNDGSCAAGELGRIPWKTLGIPEPTDTAGETLWYVVSPNFNSSAAQINSDTAGTLTVFANDGTTALTTQAIAVLFAPGGVIQNQTRSAANLDSASQYLDVDIPSTKDNSTQNGPFIAGRGSSTFNDRVVPITAADLLPAVEMNVAGTLKNILENYRTVSVCKCYPWAAPFAVGGSSLTGQNRGKLPTTALPEDWSIISASFPAWFFANAWQSVIYYSVAQMNAEHNGVVCASTTCSQPKLVVDGTPGPSVIFFTPGAVVGGFPRPSSSVDHYLRDAQNADDSDDFYVTPTATALSRNRIFVDTKPDALP